MSYVKYEHAPKSIRFCATAHLKHVEVVIVVQDYTFKSIHSDGSIRIEIINIVLDFAFQVLELCETHIGNKLLERNLGYS